MDILTLMAEAYESENDKCLMRGDDADIAARCAMAAAVLKAAEMTEAKAREVGITNLRLCEDYTIVTGFLQSIAEQAP